ncbi:unnamed protein product [Auanema sp. JU1783]|nr:unnamed protein product [Auanema sp. JU1783]
MLNSSSGFHRVKTFFFFLSRPFQLLKEARSLDNVDVKVVDYNGKMPFKLQLEQTHNSDIFIGMHGSGLTHLLFLPDWAAIMEIYNCDDAGCYSDLARLRGVKYFTWPKSKEHLIEADNIQNHPSLGKPHKKFANYRFNAGEFKKNLQKMAEYVRRHPQFLAQRRLLRRSKKGEL